MSTVPRRDISARIEEAWREQYAGGSQQIVQKVLEFEMRSVEVHRENLVPFLRGHGVGEGHRLLDFGSGPGCSATAIAFDLGAHVVGVEPNERARKVAELWPQAYGVAEKVELHYLSDTLHLPFADESFDAVLASSCLEYIKGDRGPYVREMVRILKRGGRLLIAGTSNAVWPREVHSGTWLMNWMPNFGPRLRESLGKSPSSERGITFGAILAAAPDLRFVKGEADELRTFAKRVSRRARLLPGLPAAAERALHGGLTALDRRSNAAFGWPAEAFLPWLNVGFVKT